MKRIAKEIRLKKMRAGFLVICPMIIGVIGMGCAPSQARTSDAAGSTKTIKIEAERFDFIPSEVRVRQGDRVRLIFTSRDTTHGVAIAEYDIRQDIPPRGKGETVVEFVADKVGTFSYRCSHLCGAGHAMMRGSLIVEPS